MKTKRFFSMLLAIALLLSVCPTVGAATPAEGTCGAEGSNLTWTLDEDGVLTISGNGAMKEYSGFTNEKQGYFEAPWKPLRTQITAVDIKNGVTTIGAFAFYYCTNLTTATIADSVTVIDTYAFNNCTALATVPLPKNLTTIGEGAFGFCAPLSSITLPDSVTSIGPNAFAHCTGLTTMTIPDSVTTIGSGAFQGCSGLCSVSLPDSLITIESGLFSGCTSLSTITIPDSVTEIGECAFFDCGFATVIIPTGMVAIGHGAFSYCKNLTSVTIPASVTTIGLSAFSDDVFLEKIVFEGNAPSINDDAFGRIAATATAYYPADNATWTEDVLNKDYTSGENTLTWVAYDAHFLSFTPATTAINKGETATVSLILDTDITVLGGTMTVSAVDANGNELAITNITPTNIVGCEVNYAGGKIVVATLGTLAAGTKIADISFATDSTTTAGTYTIALETELYTGDVDSNDNDRELEFTVNVGTIILTEKPVTVTWENDDGTVLELDQNVPYGSVPVYNSITPTKTSTEQYYYTFNGWYPTVGAVTTDTVYTATYTETLRVYGLTFQNESGETIATLAVPYGTEPEDIEGIPEVPEKPSTVEFNYTANEWGIQKVTGDATYKATYTAEKRSYTITWLNEDGSTLGTTTVEYGTEPTYEAPAKAKDVGYTYAFNGWDPIVSAVTGEATYKATYTKTARTYAVSVAGVDEDATLVIKDANGGEVQPTSGIYELIYNQTYAYKIEAIGYKTEEGAFTVVSSNSGLEFDSDAGTAVLTFSAMEKFVGDLDGDGTITITEAQALYNYILGEYELDEDGLARDEDGKVVFNAKVADINGNGTVGADDILPMLRLINSAAGN